MGGAERYSCCGERPRFVGINFSDRKHFEDIVAGRDWTVSDLVISKATGEPRFVVMRGIRDNGGELLGIVVANIVPERLDTVLKSSGRRRAPFHWLTGTACWFSAILRSTRPGNSATG